VTEPKAPASSPRPHVYRRARLVVLALVVGYFFLPYSVRAWIPVWLPFLAALALEVQFFVGGYLASRRTIPRPVSPHDRGPQPHDLEELGGSEWEDAYGFDDVEGFGLAPESALEEDGEELDEEPAPAPRASYLRHLPETVFVVAVVAAILFYASRPHGWAAVSTANRARAEAVFSREATAIAGHPAAVVCDTSGRHVGLVQDADGVAQVGGRTAYLVPSLCDDLYQLAFKHRIVSDSSTGRAIAVLAHEAWHLHGVADEGLANCFAFQSGVTVGERLGLPESRARDLMRGQLASNPADAADVRYLVPPGCTNGGRYDLNPGSSAFP
jgi:hypothetical protein